MTDWLKLMEEVIIPFQIAKGMVIAGSFRGDNDDSKYNKTLDGFNYQGDFILRVDR